MIDRTSSYSNDEDVMTGSENHNPHNPHNPNPHDDPYDPREVGDHSEVHSSQPLEADPADQADFNSNETSGSGNAGETKGSEGTGEPLINGVTDSDLLRAALRLSETDKSSTVTETEHPDELLLAGYVDGCLSDAEVAALEEHLADCPECLAAAEDCLALAEENAADVDVIIPRRVIERAAALVEGEQSTVAGRIELQHSGRRSALPLLRWGMLAAASIVLLLAGYHIGTSTRGSISTGEDSFISAVSFGAIVPDDESSDDLQFFALLSEGESEE